MTDEQKQESLIAEYAASVVATAPPLTLEQADLIRTHMRIERPKKKRTNPQHELIERLAKGIEDA